MSDKTHRSSHRSFLLPYAADCSRVGCDIGTKPGEQAWSVSGDIRYEALCERCHEKLFPAIHYAIRKTD